MIDINELKENSLIHGNVDPNRLRKIVDRSKELYLEPILGRDFYDHLNTATSFTTDEQTLIDNYILPYVTVSVEILASVEFNWETTNKGVLSNNDSYGSSTNWSDNDKYVNNKKKQAQKYKDKLTAYLIENESLFTLFDNACDNNLKSNSLSSQIGFVVSRKRGYHG